MAGPALEMKTVGGTGRWKSNIQRDTLRKATRVVPWLVWFVLL